METLILKGKGIIENGELERYNSIRIIHIANSSAVSYQVLTPTNPPTEMYVIASENILSTSNTGEFSKKIQLTTQNPNFYVKSSEDAVFTIISTYENISELFFNSTQYRFYDINDVIYLHPDTIISKAILTTDELLVLGGILKNIRSVYVSGLLDCEKLNGLKLKQLGISSVTGIINQQYLINLLADGFTLLTLPKSALIIVDLSDLIEKASKTERTSMYGLNCTYTRRVTFPSEIQLNNIGGNTEMTTDMVDNLLIDAAASLTAGYISLNSKRTSTSDEAVNTMTSRGITVYVTKE